MQKHRIMCLYLFLTPLLFKLGGTALLSMNVAILVHSFLWFIIVYFYLRVVSVPVLLFLAFLIYSLVFFVIGESNPRSLITLSFMIYLAQFLLVADQKIAIQCSIFAAYGFIFLMLILIFGNLYYSGFNAFSVNEYGKNLLHFDVKDNQSFGGNKNNLAGGIFYGFMGFTALLLQAKITFRVYILTSLPLLALLLNTASTRYIISMFIVLTSVVILKRGFKGVVILATLFLAMAVVFASIYAKILLAISKAISMAGFETSSQYALKAATGRAELFSDGFDIFLSNPFYGIGLENIRTKMGHFTHIDSLEVLIAVGLLGSFFYFSFFLILLIRGLGGVRLTTDLASFNWRLIFFKILLIGSFISLVLVGSVYNNPNYWQTMWLMIVSIGHLSFRLRQERKLI